MAHRPKKSTPTRQTLPCPVQGCHTQVRSCWGFTQHVGANHPGIDLQYKGNEGESVQFPLSDIDQTSPPPPPPNAFSQEEPDIHFRASDWGPSDFDLDDDAKPIPTNLDSSESDLGDGSVPADSTEFHPLINSMYNNYIILQLLNE